MHIAWFTRSVTTKRGTSRLTAQTRQQSRILVQVFQVTPGPKTHDRVTGVFRLFISMLWGRPSDIVQSGQRQIDYLRNVRETGREMHEYVCSGPARGTLHALHVQSDRKFRG